MTLSKSRADWITYRQRKKRARVATKDKIITIKFFNFSFSIFKIEIENVFTMLRKLLFCKPSFNFSFFIFCDITAISIIVFSYTRRQ